MKKISYILLAVVVALYMVFTLIQRIMHPLSIVTKVTSASVSEGGTRIQTNGPVTGLDVYLVGFHPMKEHPERQIETHHYCNQVNEDFTQCVLFDGNKKESKMNGVEYIISEKLFESLPKEEKKYWHPRNGEILSGQLIAPGMSKSAEKSLMEEKMNTYGKTWYLWNVDNTGQAADNVPMGDPILAWSFNRDGEVAPGSIEKRDKKLNVDTAEIRSGRAALKNLAHPQAGVDVLKGKFKGQTQDIPGVTNEK